MLGFAACDRIADDPVAEAPLLEGVQSAFKRIRSKGPDNSGREVVTSHKRERYLCPCAGLA